MSQDLAINELIITFRQTFMLHLGLYNSSYVYSLNDIAISEKSMIKDLDVIMNREFKYTLYINYILLKPERL